MTVTAVVTAHADPDGLKAIVDQLARQTCPPDELLAYCSGMDAPSWATEVPDRSDWGHEKRAMGLAAASCDWIGWFNSDDLYDPAYIEELVAAGDDADLVACDFMHKSGRKIEAHPDVGRITSGCYLARTSLARQVGWNGRHYEQDGQFTVDMVTAGARFVRVPHVLYTHR